MTNPAPTLSQTVSIGSSPFLDLRRATVEAGRVEMGDNNDRSLHRCDPEWPQGLYRARGTRPALYGARLEFRQKGTEVSGLPQDQSKWPDSGDCRPRQRRFRRVRIRRYPDLPR